MHAELYVASRCLHFTRSIITTSRVVLYFIRFFNVSSKHTLASIIFARICLDFRGKGRDYFVRINPIEWRVTRLTIQLCVLNDCGLKLEKPPPAAAESLSGIRVLIYGPRVAPTGLQLVITGFEAGTAFFSCSAGHDWSLNCGRIICLRRQIRFNRIYARI